MNGAIGENDAKRQILEQNVERITDFDIDPDRVEARSLFVKNINFKTTDENLRKHFSELMKDGRILSVKVKKHLKNGKIVSIWGLDSLSLTPLKLLQMFAEICRGQFWTAMLLFYNLVMSRMMHRSKRQLRRIRVLNKIARKKCCF